MPRLTAALAALVAALPAAAMAADPEPPRPGMELAFSDEFDGRSAMADRWDTCFHDGARTHGDELQGYLDGDGASAPLTVSDGMLAITARPAAAGEAPGGLPYVSGMLSSHRTFSFRYGYVEARMRVPAGKGLWPAFWLFAPGAEPYGEIDVAEIIGDEPGKAYATTHSGPRWQGRRIDQVEHVAASGDFSDGFHTFAVDWNEERVTFIVDGKETGSFETTPELRRPMHLILNLAVGGEWAGPPDGATRFPASLQVDYVRVWRATAR